MRRIIEDPNHKVDLEFYGNGHGVHVKCSCEYELGRWWCRVNENGMISQTTLTRINEHILSSQKKEKTWTEEETRPIHVATAEGQRVTYEGWVVHSTNLPDRMKEDIPAVGTCWIAATRNRDSWKSQCYATRENAIARIVHEFNKMRRLGRIVTIHEDLEGTGTKALDPTLAEAVAFLVKQDLSKKHIGDLQKLVEETDDALAALTLLKQRLHAELTNQFSL